MFDSYKVNDEKLNRDFRVGKITQATLRRIAILSYRFYFNLLWL